MSKTRASSRAIYALAMILLTWAAGGCSSRPGNGPGVRAGSGVAGPTRLDAALSHVADTPGTRGQVSFDDTARLVRLSGTSPGTTKGFALLRGLGASSLAPLAPVLASETGINLFSEDYAITAGSPPRMLTLLQGGQSASLVTSRLTKLGWKQGAGLLNGPRLSGASQKAALYAVPMHVVRADGPDVTFGESGADLSQIGSPSGRTLASDPVVRALAGCLGDVLAAEVSVGGNLGGSHPVAVAVGVRAPARDATAPHAVACVAWPNQAEAAHYAADVRKALSTGLSAATNQQYSTLLPHASVTSIGGSQHIVEWQADTPGRASLIFEMYLYMDLPALPNCAKVPAAARSRVIGCV